ncbi:MAG TPA: helix-hairpin-helix domain-containing protein [Marinobacter sp.]
MAKKNKPSVEKIVKKVNKEFERTSSQIESLINDALKQFDTLQNQVQDPVRKLLREMDDLREREMKRFNEEFERRLKEFHDLQDAILDRLGISQKERQQAAKAALEEKPKAATKAPAATKPAKAPKTPKAESAKKVAAAKPATKKAPAKAKPDDKGDLTRVKGIGPATASKLQEAGITSIEQIANPSAAEQEKLAGFSKMRGFANWSSEAKKLL